MALPKPVKSLDWTDGAPAKVQEPSGAKKALGYISEEKPDPLEMNFNFFTTDEWIKYLESITDDLIGLQSVFDYVIGVGGTHATINALVADGNVLPYSRIFVKDAAVVTVTQVISKEGLEFTFHPGAHYSKGAVLGIGLDITAKRVKIMNGRFLNFDEAGGVAVRLSAGAKNCHVINNTFFNNTKSIENLGANNNTANNLDEVA